jgi:arginase
MGGRTIELILVPYDVERADTGMARGPLELVSRGFARRLEELGASVHTAEIWLRESGRGKAESVAELGRSLARAVATAHARRRFPLILSGGCLQAVGIVTGLQRSGRELDVVWVDAHGDFNTPESTPSGNWDGMALAAVCGRSLPEVYKAVELRPIHFRNVVHLGGRAFDPPEVEDIRRLKLDVVEPARIAAAETRRRLARDQGGQRDVYLHIDMDGIDPSDAPAVHYPEPGGPSLDDLVELLGELKGEGSPAAMTLSALNFERADEEAARRTVAACVRLVSIFLDGSGPGA